MIKVVYFNQWFSSISSVIEDIKNRHGNSVKIIGSSRNKDHVFKDSVDIFVHEDWVETKDKEESMRNYLEWVVNLCTEYHVDYFFCKKHQDYIAKHKKELLDIRVLPLIEESDIIDLIDSKSALYDRLSKNNTLKEFIPEYHVYKESLHAMEYVKENLGKNKICFKLNSDEGGASFRVIDDTIFSLKSLSAFRVNVMSSADTVELLTGLDDYTDKLIFMEYLDSPEISVDCYNSKKGFIAICRSKDEKRKEHIYYDEKLWEICKTIADELKLKFPFNVQFRVKHNQENKLENLRLLEVNTRLSGGVYYEVIKGLNIAEVCLLDMMNRPEMYDIGKYMNFKDYYAGHVEKAVLLENN